MIILGLILGKAASYSTMLPFLCSIANYRGLQQKYISIFILIVSATFISIYSSIQNSIDINNMPSLHLLTVLEFLCIAFFYASVFKNKSLKRITVVVGIGFTLFSSFNSFFLQDIYTYNSYARGLEAFLVICLSLLYFYEMLQRQEEERLEQNPTFWFNTAFLLYFASTQFLFLFNNLILSTYSTDIAKLFWDVHAFVCILYYLLLAVGIWKVRSKPTSPISLS